MPAFLPAPHSLIYDLGWCLAILALRNLQHRLLMLEGGNKFELPGLSFICCAAGRREFSESSGNSLILIDYSLSENGTIGIPHRAW